MVDISLVVHEDENNQVDNYDSFTHVINCWPQIKILHNFITKCTKPTEATNKSIGNQVPLQ
jgi:hypothetical protein